MKISSKYYFWKGAIFVLLGFVTMGISFFYHQWKDVSIIFLMLGLIIYNQYEIELIKEKLNERRPPDED